MFELFKKPFQEQLTDEEVLSNVRTVERVIDHHVRLGEVPAINIIKFRMKILEEAGKRNITIFRQAARGVV